MAVAPTGAIYKALKFDNVSSRTYGVYITGEAVYNAPERDVEMITIPGRNGTFALDNGRFENIEVSYPAGIYADTEADFRQAISDFRNFLCSRKGYVRLQDEYNPDEYRMAVYKSGLDVTPAMLRAGEFNIVFDCKPQRWLTSGETKVTIANSGDTITNPTLFDASPMVETTGYGTLTVNGHEVELASGDYGTIEILTRQQKTTPSTSASISMTASFDRNLVEIGDTMTLNSLLINAGQTYYGSVSSSMRFYSDRQYTIGTATSTATNLSYYLAQTFTSNNDADFQAYLKPATFTVGTPSSINGSVVGQFPVYDSGNNLVETAELSLAITLDYDGDDTITVTITRTINNDALNVWSIDTNRPLITRRSEVIANSTATYLGNPTYIDCDLGVCYKIEGGSVIDLNKYIDLGSEMPFLEPGSNTITFDNTFTKIQIIPRWWKV